MSTPLLRQRYRVSYGTTAERVGGWRVDRLSPTTGHQGLTSHHNSVVMTVFMIGIFDSFFLRVMLSVTSQGEISSRLVFA